MNDYLEDLLEMSIDEDESIEEYKERYVPVSEGVLFKSEDGKKLQKELRDYAKKIREDYKAKNSFGERVKKGIKAGLTAGYNKDMLSKMSNFTKNKLNPVWESDVIQVVTYTNNGVYVDYYKYFVGFYKNNIYRVTLVPSGAYCGVGTVKELKSDKCIIPKELIEVALKTTNKDSTFDITSNKIKNLDRSTLDKVMEIYNKKYDEKLYAKIQFKKSIVFKRRK